MAKLPEHDAIETGKRLRVVRGRLGYTQAELAAVLGISLSHVSKLEIGVGRMSQKVLADIVANTDVSKEWLLRGRGEPWVGGEPPEEKMKDESNDIPKSKPSSRVPDDALIERIVVAALDRKNQELAKTMAVQLGIDKAKALAAIIRTGLPQ